MQQMSPLTRSIAISFVLFGTFATTFAKSYPVIEPKCEVVLRLNRLVLANGDVERVKKLCANAPNAACSVLGTVSEVFYENLCTALGGKTLYFYQKVSCNGAPGFSREVRDLAVECIPNDGSCEGELDNIKAQYDDPVDFLKKMNTTCTEAGKPQEETKSFRLVGGDDGASGVGSTSTIFAAVIASIATALVAIV